METLQDLDRKIQMANDLLAVVKTMKTLASVNIRQFEQAVVSLDAYVDIVNMAFRVFLHDMSGEIPQQKLSGREIFICIGSDQGLCGQFNEKATLHLLERMQSAEQPREGAAVWSVGERMHAAVEDLFGAPERTFPLPSGLSEMGMAVEPLLNALQDEVLPERGSKVSLCYNRPEQAGRYDTIIELFFPLFEKQQGSLFRKSWPRNTLPLLMGETNAFFGELVRQYLSISFYRALALSMAAENAARMASMQAAEKNIREMGETLNARFRRERQEQITRELFDVVAGFETLAGQNVQGEAV